MDKASKVMEVVEPRLADVSRSLDTGLGALKEGLVEALNNGFEVFNEMNRAQQEAHRNYVIELDGNAVGKFAEKRVDNKFRGKH